MRSVGLWLVRSFSLSLSFERFGARQGIALSLRSWNGGGGDEANGAFFSNVRSEGREARHVHGALFECFNERTKFEVVRRMPLRIKLEGHGALVGVVEPRQRRREEQAGGVGEDELAL